MLCSCLWALYPRIVAPILGFCMKLNDLLYIIFVFQFDVVDRLCYWVSLLTGMCTSYLHVVVGLLFRNLVARKTHSYYVVGLDGCVPVGTEPTNMNIT